MLQKLKFVFVLVFLFILAFYPSLSFAQENQKVISVPSDQTINEDYFASSDIVEILGTVNGDVFVAGGQVVVRGTINGDLWVAGGTVDITGSITGDTNIAGGQITVAGQVGEDLTIGGGNVDIRNEARIHKDFIVGAGNISLTGVVNENVRIAAGNAVIGNTVGGNVSAATGQLRLAPGANVSGNLTYYSNQRILLERESTVSGNINQRVPVAPDKRKAEGALIGAALIWKAINFLSTLILGLILLRLFPKFAQAALRNLSAKPWLSLGLGFLFLIIAPILAAILFITVIGIPLGVILFGLYWIILYLSRIFAIFWIGDRAFNMTKRNITSGWVFLLGLVIYYIVTLIPVIGGLVSFIVLLLGLGTFLLTISDFYYQRKEKI